MITVNQGQLEEILFQLGVDLEPGDVLALHIEWDKSYLKLRGEETSSPIRIYNEFDKISDR